MIPHTEHPIIEWPRVGSHPTDPTLLAAAFRDGTRVFTRDQFLAYHKEREAQIARMADDPYRYGWINPAWARADAAFTGLREKFPKGVTEVLILGGNRSGKSRYFARRCMQHLVEKPGAKVWCLQSTEAASIQNQQPYLWEYLPAEWKPMASGKLKKGAVANITYSQKGGFTENSFVLPNGSQCWFKFYSMDVTSIEGSELDFAWADELVTPDWIEALRFRLLTRNGELGIGFTPVEGYTPTVKEYLDGATTLEEEPAPLLPIFKREDQAASDSSPLPHLTSWNTNSVEEYLESAKTLAAFEAKLRAPVKKQVGLETVPRLQQCVREKARVVYFHTADNPFGNPEAMETELAGSNRERILMRAYGVPTKAKLSMFPKFRDQVHIVPHDQIPKDGTCYHFVDPGEGKTWAMLWVRFTPDGRCWVYREFPDQVSYIEGIGHAGAWAEPDGKLLDGRPGPAQKACAGFTFSDYKRVIEMAEKEDAAEPLERWMDSRYGNTPSMTEEGVKTLIDQCDEKMDMQFRATSGKAIVEGVAVINDLLGYDDTREIDATNSPKLLISERCQNLIFSLKTWTGADGKKSASKDFIDILRYIALADGVGYQDPNHLAPRGGGCY